MLDEFRIKFEQVFNKLLQKARVGPRPPEDPNEPRYADINERVLAAALDLFLLYTLLFPVFMWLQFHIMGQVDQEALRSAGEAASHSTREALRLLAESGHPQLWLLNTALQLAVIGVFVVGSYAYWGTTPGKYLLGLRVADARTHEAPRLWQHILRYIGYLPACLPLMIGIIWISFNKERRGWHDFMARTVVLHTRPRGWAWNHIKRGYHWVHERLR